MNPLADLYKDEVLQRLAKVGNVAQFVSFDSALSQRHSALKGLPPDHQFLNYQEAVAELLRRAGEGAVNIRTYRPDSPDGNEFVFDIRSTDVALQHMRRLADQGLHLIVNERINIHDGGVSGVLWGTVIEFAPDATPRCVEEADVVSLPAPTGLAMLKTIYGWRIDVNFPTSARVEFSLHPQRRGVHDSHTILWQISEAVGAAPYPRIVWPNRFSRFLGDKAYGLLLASALGFAVPMTIVLCRRIPPFRFGEDTGRYEVWVRTCPSEPQPGLFATVRGWTDPFALLSTEDPSGKEVPGVMIQRAVQSLFSGAILTSKSGEPIIEGVRGTAQEFMLGRQCPSSVPGFVRRELEQLHQDLVKQFGSVRCEWAHDGQRLWLLQLQQEIGISSEDIIVPGSPARFHKFHASLGIDALRRLVAVTIGSGDGIVIEGAVGLTSHMADLLRRHHIPSMIASGR